MLENSYERMCPDYSVNHQVLCANVEELKNENSDDEDKCNDDNLEDEKGENCLLRKQTGYLSKSAKPLVYQLANL